MENTTNPYQAPESDLETPQDHLEFLLGEPQKQKASHGWLWIKSAFQLFKHSPGGWILAMLVGFILMIVISLIPIIGSIFLMLTSYVWSAGIAYGAREVERGEKFKVSYLFSGFKFAAGKLILLSFLLSIVSTLIMVACMGPVYVDLLVGNDDPQAFAGIEPMQLVLTSLIATALYIPLMMAVWFAPALIIFHQMPIFGAIKASFAGCLKNILPFLIYGLIMFVLMILAIIPVGLGYLILMPVLFASIYTSYKDIYLRPSK